MAHSRKQNKLTETVPEEVKTSDLLDKEFFFFNRDKKNDGENQ